MAVSYFYVDAATGTDALTGGTSWANAVAGLQYCIETLTTPPVAGDVVYVRANTSETTVDQHTASFTLTSPGTLAAPLNIIGVKSGTVHTGTGVVNSDIADRSVDQPVFNVTSGNWTIKGHNHFTGMRIKLDASVRLYPYLYSFTHFVECDIDWHSCRSSSGRSGVHLTDCDVNIQSSGYLVQGQFGIDFVMTGGSVLDTGTTSYLILKGYFTYVTLIGVDLSGLTLTNIASIGNAITQVRLINCSMPASYAAISATPTQYGGFVEQIGCNNSSSLANTSSYQDYDWEDGTGSVSNSTEKRTGGADDGATGGFSYALTPKANAVFESSMFALPSPWLSKWVSGSASTLTVYVANDGGVNYNGDEMWCEFYTPDSGDTAQHEKTYDTTAPRLGVSSTAIATDVSSWTSAGNPQKFSITLTPGFEGWAYARIFVAKNQATPDIVYLDPEIEVT